MSVEEHLTVYKGEQRKWRFTVTNADDGTRQDLTGATIEFQVKIKDGDPDPPSISKSVGSGIVLLNQSDPATKGQFELTLLPADTSSLQAKVYRYDLITVIGGVRSFLRYPSNFTLKPVVNLP